MGNKPFTVSIAPLIGEHIGSDLLSCHPANFLPYPFHGSPLNTQYVDTVYYITSRVNEKKVVFKDDKDRINLLKTIQHVKNGIIDSVMSSV